MKPIVTPIPKKPKPKPKPKEKTNGKVITAYLKDEILASIFLLTVLSILAYTVYINFIYEPPIKFKGYY